MLDELIELWYNTLVNTKWGDDGIGSHVALKMR